MVIGPSQILQWYPFSIIIPILFSVFITYSEFTHPMAKKSKNKNKSTYNKQVEAQKRRDKRRHKRQDSDSCEFDMRIQLEKYGLGLKEVEGDG